MPAAANLKYFIVRQIRLKPALFAGQNRHIKTAVFADVFIF
jgi:hypothetical protein